MMVWEWGGESPHPQPLQRWGEGDFLLVDPEL